MVISEVGSTALLILTFFLAVITLLAGLALVILMTPFSLMTRFTIWLMTWIVVIVSYWRTIWHRSVIVITITIIYSQAQSYDWIERIVIIRIIRVIWIVW